MTVELIFKILLTVLFGVGGAVLVLAGAWYTLLTSGGDRGGDSGLAQLGCLSLVAGIGSLAASVLIGTLA